MRLSFLIVLLICFFKVNAQHSKISSALKLELKKHVNKDELIPLFVVGDASKIKLEVIKLKGEVIRSTGNIVQIKLQVKHVELFSANSFVKSIPYSFSKGHVLNDLMIINNNVLKVHNGISPLPKAYTGKGVVYGIIDTGHDIDHPDFKDTLGNTRIYRIWDQVTGQFWDSTAINNGSCTHHDYNAVGHGTHVSGISSGNGLGLGNYKGVAPEATIVVVASNFNSFNWLSTIVDAVAYIYSVADSLNMPCVINASIGDYFGSHDGTDPAAVLIDSLVNYKPGRAFVCAGGNAGSFNWHVEQIVAADTSFSWLKYNPSSALGVGSVYYEVWADTADLNNVNYAFGANLPSGTFQERGKTQFHNIQNRLGFYSDTIKNGANILAIVQTYAEIQGDKYYLEVFLNEPDSNTYNFSILSTGSGKFDFWSTTALGTSDIVETGLPSSLLYPPMLHYTLPDSAKTTVSSFSCSQGVLTVANYENRKTYFDVDAIIRTNTYDPGVLSISSSLGPDRRGNIKPDIGATGGFTLGPAPASVISTGLAGGPLNRSRIALGGMHRVNGGTSMASPVVAGVVALYFEKCPTATMAEVKAAITSTAKQDIFTGVVPNFGFGYGKVNAFAALNTSNHSLTLGNNHSICDGEEVQINTSFYSSYNWSTGDSTQSVIFDSTNTNIYVDVTSSGGCSARSDTIAVNWHPLPTKPTIILSGGSTLLTSTDLNLYWYFNNTILGGETDTILIAQNNGNYFLQVADSFGCVNNSDTVNLTAVGIENLETPHFSIYPNPTKGRVTVKLKNNSFNIVHIINPLGEIVFKQGLKENQKKVSINISNFSDGIYYIKLTSNDKSYLEKLILLR